MPPVPPLGVTGLSPAAPASPVAPAAPPAPAAPAAPLSSQVVSSTVPVAFPKHTPGARRASATSANSSGHLLHKYPGNWQSPEHEHLGRQKPASPKPGFLVNPPPQ